MTIRLALGFLNKINNRFIPVFDYDLMGGEKTVISEINRFQGLYGLNACALYETKRGHHAIFYWNQVSKKKYEKMLEKSASDWRFKKLFEKMNCSNLRLKGKYANDRRIVGVIASPFKSSELEEKTGDFLLKFHNKLG